MAYFTKGLMEVGDALQNVLNSSSSTINTKITANAPIVNLYGNDPNFGQSTGYNGHTTPTEDVVIKSSAKKSTPPPKKTVTWYWWLMLMLLPISYKLFVNRKKQSTWRYR